MAQTKVKLISDGVIDVNHLASGHSITTDNIGEGSNLYYTDARVSTYLSTNSYATEGYVTTAVSNLVAAAPSTLDTLNELAAALGDDPNFATTVTNSIATKLPLAGGTLTGTLYAGGLVRLTGTTSSNSQLDLPVDWGALRWYDGTTFKGGIGTAGWSGVGSGNDLTVYLNNGNFHVSNNTSPFVTFDRANERVGIGTTSPSHKLHLVEGGTLDTVLKLEQTRAAYANNIIMTAADDNGGRWNSIRSQTNGGTEHWSIGGLGSGANTFTIRTAGTERMRITGSGNVGIGTTAPYSNLTLNYTGDNLAGTYYGNLVLNATNNSTWSRIRLDRAGNSRFGIGLNPNDKFIISNLNVSGAGGADDTAFVITNTSNVGIGTANPTEKLTVNGSIGLEISGNVEFHIGYYNGGLNFSETNVADYRLFIKDGGNVGIGTSSPGEKLEVAGVTKSNSFEAKAFASIAAGTPYTGTIPYGISKADISSPCDNNWRTVLSNVDFNKTIMWVSLGDAVSKDMATYFISATFPAYGVASFSNTEYVDGGWNTGGFEFSLSGTGGNYSILVRATSYYSSGNTAFGSIYFLRLE